LDQYWEDYNALVVEEQEKDTTASFCMEALMFGRKVILQDLAVIRKTSGEELFIFKHLAYQGRLWKEFCLAMDHYLSLPRASTEGDASLASIIARGLEDVKTHISLELKSFQHEKTHLEKELPPRTEMPQALSKTILTLKSGGWPIIEDLWRDLAISSENKLSYLEAEKMGSQWRRRGICKERRNASIYWSKLKDFYDFIQK